jgi:catechol 2,3-dioxygenase-like lactoylglutathione lyase family enzyme
MKGDVLPGHGRVSHVVYCVRLEHFDEAVAFWTDGLGVRFERVDIQGAGLRIEFAEDAGIEVIAPTEDEAGRGSLAQDFLDENGEGVLGVVYRVPDLDGSIAAVGRGGVDVRRRASFTGKAPWSDRYDALEEAHLTPLHGMRVTLGRIDYKE